MKRIDCGNSASEALMRALENVERMKHVCILYTTNDDEKAPGGMYVQDDLRLDELNYMLDMAKRWIFD